MQEFSLWLEFEHVDLSTTWMPGTDTFVTGGDWDRQNEACNVVVTLPDGRRYGINVWTYRFLQTVVQMDAKSGENLSGLYQRPPDLFVKELTRACLEVVVADLLLKGPLEQVLNPGILAKESHSEDES